MPPKFKCYLNDDDHDVTGSMKSERRNLLKEDSNEEEDFFLRSSSGIKFRNQVSSSNWNIDKLLISLLLFTKIYIYSFFFQRSNGVK
uniref:Uncharacterized protein n=1 Tax=Vombatus ursinus TaxID=29139 RepID=A0A4X2KSL9_VOMUR